MTRRVFISYQHEDHMKAHGLNLITYNENVKVDFTGRHLLQPVKSSDANYITSKIQEQIKGSSATIVLIGSKTAESDWVRKEIEWSAQKGNGIVGIRVERDAPIPSALEDCGAEILDWAKPEDVQEFDGAIERAIMATERGRRMPMNTESTCTR